MTEDETMNLRPTPEALEALAAECVRARKKFPNTDLLLIALMEEVGELARVYLERDGRDREREEALQVACVAMRIFEQGDASHQTTEEDDK